MMIDNQAILKDELWERVTPFLPPASPCPKGGRPRASDRECFEGIVWVLRSGARWRDLPDHFPSPVTCWRRHRDWTAAGVWKDVWDLVLVELQVQGRLDVDELFIDATFTPAKKGVTRSATPSGARG
jgi:transposase